MSVAGAAPDPTPVGGVEPEPERQRGAGWLLAVWRETWLLFVVPIALTGMFMLGEGGFSWRRAGLHYLANFIVTLGIGGTITVLYSGVACRILPRCRGPVARALTHAAIVLTGVLLGGEAALRVLGPIGFQIGPEMRRSVFGVGLLVSTIIVLVVIGYSRIQGRARASELRAADAQREAMRARLEALQARTNPHFLFNSLNAVAALIEEDPRRAEDMLARLATLFRYALDGSRQRQVPLADELAAVRMYLEVEAVRFGPRLASRVDVEPGLEGVPVPPLLLQPLVENAVLHGIAARRDGGRIAIVARRDVARLLVVVEDDGPGPDGSQHRGTQTALEDLRRRLHLIYGDDASLDCSAPLEGGWRVQVALPLTGAPSP